VIGRQRIAFSVAAALLAVVGSAAAQGPGVLDGKAVAGRIQKYRTAEVTLTVLGADGRPLAGAAVTVGQVSHKFLFGSNAFKIGRCGSETLEKGYRKRYADLLNFATLPFYWGSYERAEGTESTDQLKAMAQWCRDNHIATKGHPLCWHTVVPRWLNGKTTAQVKTLQMARIARIVKQFDGLVDTWDVINEAVVMPRHRTPNAITTLCKEVGQVELIKQTFAAARKAGPTATLILNDYDTSRRYEDLIKRLKTAGLTPDVIGIQSHMHNGYWGAKKAWDVCERFAKIGRPLHFTELTILSGPLKTDGDWMKRRSDWHTSVEGEKLQATQVAEFYTVLFSHPAVEAITWWDFSDLGAWQGAPAGLIRKDMSPKPAYTALMKLIKTDWWTGPRTLKTDARGRVTFRGYLGGYEARAAGAVASFRLDKPGKATASVTLGKK